MVQADSVAEFDPITEEYLRSHRLWWREYVEHYTFDGLLGEVAGLDVLELACGAGFYARRVKANGAGRVKGIDISEGMIAAARRFEAARRLGIAYEVADASSYRDGAQYDLVLAAYLLNYARKPEELQAFCRTIADHLRPGGRFVAVNNNLWQSPDTYEAMRRYGFTKYQEGELCNGTPIRYELLLHGAPPSSFYNYYLGREDYEQALGAAGLDGPRWSRPQLDPRGVYPADYWSPFFEDPPIVFLECRKPNSGDGP